LSVGHEGVDACTNKFTHIAMFFGNPLRAYLDLVSDCIDAPD